MITPPQPSDDVRTLWRKVDECVKILNAIQSMKVVVEGKIKMMGTLEVGGNASVLQIKEQKEVDG